MLCNTKDYRNYATTIRKELNIPIDKRSRLTKSIQRLEEKNLIFENTDENNKLFYSINDIASEYVLKIDRSKYETKEEKQQIQQIEIIKLLEKKDYEKQKKSKYLNFTYE